MQICQVVLWLCGNPWKRDVLNINCQPQFRKLSLTIITLQYTHSLGF